MQTLNRDELIEQIAKTENEQLVVPAKLFGKEVLLKTTKSEMINRIIETFKANEDTGVILRRNQRLHTIIVESGIVSHANGNEAATSTSGAANVVSVKRGRGRPKGAKDTKPRAPRGSRQTVRPQVDQKAA